MAEQKIVGCFAHIIIYTYKTKPKSILMKATFKFLFSLLVIASLSASFSQSNVKASTLYKDTTSGITYTDVYNYLIQHEYTVLGITQMSNGLDWKATTVKYGIRYMTIVHTDGTNIIGNEDVPL
jgi:hypothetical protein